MDEQEAVPHASTEADARARTGESTGAREQAAEEESADVDARAENAEAREIRDELAKGPNK